MFAACCVRLIKHQEFTIHKDLPFGALSAKYGGFLKPVVIGTPYLYICLCVCVCVCWGERMRERENDRERVCVCVLREQRCENRGDDSR